MSCANEVVISGAGRLWPNRSVNSIPAVAWARVRSVSSKSVGLNMGFEQSVDHGRVGAQEPGGDHEHRGGEPAARSQCRLVDQYVTAVGGHLGVDRRQFPPAATWPVRNSLTAAAPRAACSTASCLRLAMTMSAPAPVGGRGPYAGHPPPHIRLDRHGDVADHHLTVRGRLDVHLDEFDVVGRRDPDRPSDKVPFPTRRHIRQR